MDEQAEIKKEFRRLYDTALSAGLKIISDDNCCRLLAWLYIYGGENESVVLDKGINSLFWYAQRRLNLLGGEFPDRLIFLVQKYEKSVTDIENPPEWVFELEKKYGLKGHRGKNN